METISVIIPGIGSKPTIELKETGCDFCWWVLRTSNKGENDVRKPFVLPGRVYLEVTCSWKAENIDSKCKSIVKNLKISLVQEAKKLGEPVFQYVNTPSCDEQSNFAER